MYRQGVYQAMEQKRSKDDKLHPSFRAPAVAAAKPAPAAAAQSKPMPSATSRESRYARVYFNGR